MTTFPTPLGTLLALLGACTPDPRPVPVHAPAAPACILAHDGAGYSARLTAAGPVAGHYDLSLRGAGLAIDQSGDFEARAGETLVLGRAGVPRVAQAELLVTVAGTTYRCPVEG